MEEKWTFDKLDSSNWITWKFQMRHLLRVMAKGLWKYVDGSETLAEDAAEAVRTKFRQESQKAVSTIVMAISTPQLYLITSCPEEPKEIWNTLRKHFERETLANKLFLKKQYFRKEVEEGISIAVHLKEMKEITDRLASIGAPISEEDQVVTLLGSLPPSYSTLVTALEARVDDIQLDFVQQTLIHEEQKQKGSQNNVSRQDSALVGAHNKRENTRKPPVCWNCQEVGHIQRNCPKRNSSFQHKAKTAEEKSPNADDDLESAFAASPHDLPKMVKWLVDSGASSHMTSQKEFLVNYRKFNTPEKVGLGDGSCGGSRCRKYSSKHAVQSEQFQESCDVQCALCTQVSVQPFFSESSR